MISPSQVYLSSFVSIHVDVGVMVNIERHLQSADTCLLHRNRIAKKITGRLFAYKEGQLLPSSFPFLHLPMCTIYVNLELFSFSVYHCLKRHGVDGLGDCGQLAPVLIRHTFAGMPRTLLKDFKTAFLSFITSWLLQVQTESNTLSQEKKYHLIKKILRDVQYEKNE